MPISDRENQEYFSVNQYEEKVLEYKPSIVYTPDELKTIDNTRSLPTDSGLGLGTAAAITQKYVNNNVVDLINLVNSREAILSSLRNDMSLYLLDMNFLVRVNQEVPNVFKDIVINNTIPFEIYQNIPNTEEYRMIHDMWFYGAASTRGNAVAELYPITRDMQDDIDRMKAVIDNVILYQTGFTMNDDPENIKKFIYLQASEYENNLNRFVMAQRNSETNKQIEIIKNNRILESEMKLSVEMSTLWKNSVTMLDRPLRLSGKTVYNEIDGVYSSEAIEEINIIKNASPTDSKNLSVPILFGYKDLSGKVIKNRIAETNQYSHENKEAILKKTILLGRTWKNICIPDIANYLEMGYNKGKLLSHLTSGVMEINNQFVDSLKDYYKTSLGEMNARQKLTNDVTYKNMARHIYNNINGGS